MSRLPLATVICAFDDDMMMVTVYSRIGESAVHEGKKRIVELVRREFTVDAPRHAAWEWLARVESWPSWAKHIKSARLSPNGPLTAESTGTFRLAGGVRSKFRMEIFEPPRRWQWVGMFLTVTVHYDHRFEPVDDDHTRLIWQVEATGPGARTLGRMFGAIYDRNLARAIPNLQAELRTRTDDDET